MGMKRFSGPGEQWSTYGGYYMSSNPSSHTLPGMRPMPNMANPRTEQLAQVRTGGLTRLATAASEGWDRFGQDQDDEDVQEGLRVMGAGPGPGPTTTPPGFKSLNVQPPAAPAAPGGSAPYGGYFLGTNKPMPPAKVVSGNAPPPAPPKVAGSTPPPAPKSRRQAFQHPTLFS